MVSLWVGVWVAAGAFLPVVVALTFTHLSAILDVGADIVVRVRHPRRYRTDRLSVEQLAADLHRLSVHLEQVERSRELHRVARLTAASLAYDDVLLSACRTLEVEVPARAPLHPIERLETEAALAQKGLVW